MDNEFNLGYVLDKGAILKLPLVIDKLDVPTSSTQLSFFIGNCLIVPDYWFNSLFNSDPVLLDAGGNGDCFLRCFNYIYFHSFQTVPLSSMCWYQFFQLPMGTYLEEQHISLIATYYKVCICVTRTYEGNLIPRVFGESLEHPWVFIHNDFPYHFFGYLFEEKVSPDLPLQDELPNYEYPVLMPRPTFTNMCSYMSQSGDFIFPDCFSVLEAFSILHYELVLMLQSLLRENKVPQKNFFKLYYKFRHNVFSFICKSFLTQEIGKFETDIPLSNYIKSDKTPDFVLEDADTINIFEFSVTNRYDVADYNKGGGSQDIKYSFEADLITKNTGKLCTVRIFSAVLDNLNFEEIFQQILLHNPQAVRNSFLEDFMNICNKNRALINSSHLKSSFTFDTVPLNTDLTSFDRPDLPSTIMLSSELLSAVLKGIVNFSNSSAYILTKGRNKYVRCCFELSTNHLYLDYTKTHIYNSYQPGDFLFQMNSEGINFILACLFVYNEGKKTNLSALRGTVPVTVNRSRISNIQPMEPPVRFSNNIFSRTDILDQEYSDLLTKGYNILGSTNPVYFPPDYLEKLCKHDFDNILHSKSKKLLANCHFHATDLKECMDIFNSSVSDQNNITNCVYNPKPTFLLPVLDNHESSTHPVKNYLLSQSLKCVTGYTKKVLNLVNSDKFVKKFDRNTLSQEIINIKEKLNEANRKYFEVLKKKNLLIRHKYMSTQQKLLVSRERQIINDVQKKYSILLGNAKGSRNDNLVRLSRGQKGENKRLFDAEMKHFNEDKSIYKGFGIMNEVQYDGFDKYIKQFISELTRDENIPIVPLLNSFRSPGPELLTKLKNEHTDRANQLANNFFLGKRIDAIATFYSKVALHLFNESTKSYNSSFVKVENLGYENMIILVRGGSKIYKNQTSKLFKIIFYCNQQDSIFLGYRDNKNFHCYPQQRNILIETPWSQLHQDILFDYISLRERSFMNLFSTHTRVTQDLDAEPKPLTLLPFVLSLHNRRKTEKFLHNSRYLIVNPLAEHANLQGIIASFAGFNYTYLDAWLRKRIEIGYPDFASSVMKARNLKNAKIDSILSTNSVRDLWLNSVLENADQLTNFIYITYMMTKAPVNSSIEQASNLWEILSDVKLYSDKHPDVEGLKDISQRFDLFNDGDEVYSDDFKYDPVFCNYLGFHMSGYLLNMFSIVEIQNQWEILKSQDIDCIANSKGLRGWNNDNFFNKKGYEVVYSKVDELLNDVVLDDLVVNYLNHDANTSRNMINADKIRISQDQLEQDLIFHVVHKIQRGGGREIFCMDLNTKQLQNPLEKFFKFLCKRVPNEFISIPSNKRHGLIHSDFYEKKINKDVGLVYRWVLDCRRWAPHSVFQKYIYFIEGMSSILPPDFIAYFRQFSSKMFEKKFVTRKHVYNKLVNNQRFEDYKDLLKVSNTIADAYELTVSFSFVMGIFNYLSTLMHAANQILAGEIIRNQCIRKGEGLVILDAKCHSDDSVVSSYHQNPTSLRRTFVLYDWLLKSANHMLSIKKSQINQDVYLEFLSVLYLYDRFLPVLPKFSSTVPFKPSDRGYSSDISFSITQSLEMLSQGGSYEEAFIMMKLTERFIQNCYKINIVKELPYQLLGIIDSHPMELLYAGGYSDVYRSMKYDEVNFWRSFNFLENNNLINSDQADLTLKWDMSSKLTGKPKEMLFKYSKILENLPENISWTLNNLKLGNSKLNLIWYLNKLNDRSFYSSLVDEPVARKFARIFGAGSYRTVISKDSVRFSVPRLALSLDTILRNDDKSHIVNQNYFNFIKFCCRDLDFFYESIEGASWSEVHVANNKEKPIIFYQGVSTLGNINLSAAEFVSYNREPNGFKLMGKRSNPARDSEKINIQLELLGLDTEHLSNDQLYSVARKITREDSKTYRLVMPLPSGERKIDSYTSAINSLCYNSIKWKKLMIRARQSAVVDWNCKVVQGKLPHTVQDFLECNWMINLCAKYDVLQEDIFKEDLPLLLKSLKKSIPDEWKSIVNSQIQENKSLLNTPYWSCWTKRQVKLGNSWYGSGECFINLPEMFIQLLVTHGEITSIRIETDYIGPLSTASSWYLNIFFHYSGIHTEVVPNDFGDPTKIYLGYSSAEGIFSTGRSKTTDLIYLSSEFSKGIIPSFCFNEDINFVRTKNSVSFVLKEREIKVDFYIPLDQPLILDLKKYIDKEKLRDLSFISNKVNNFIRDYASSVLGFTRKDPKVLRNNFDRSLIYNIIYNYSDKTRVFSDEQTDQPLFNSFSEWKKLNPNFGFPNEEEMLELIRGEEMPPVSPKILDFLKNLGYAGLTQSELQNVITKVLFLPMDDRESYLLSIYPHLSLEHKLSTLVVVEKSDRIFDCCKMMPKHKYTIVVSLFQILADAVEQGSIYSSTLRQWCVRYGKAGRSVSSKEMIRIMFSQILIDSLQIDKSYFDNHKVCVDMLNIISELLEENLLQWLNIVSLNDPMFRSVEFSIEKKRFLDWVNDLFDNMSLFFSMDSTELMSYQKVLGQQKGRVKEGKYAREWSQFQHELTRMEFYKPIESLFLTFNKKLSLKSGAKKRVKKTFELFLSEETKPGKMLESFEPFSEEGQEEFEYAWEYEDNFEDFEVDLEADLPTYGYCYVSSLSINTLTKVRGTAWNMIYSFYHVDESILKAADELFFFKPQVTVSNNVYCSQKTNLMLCYTGSKSKLPKIKGYVSLEWHDVLKMIHPGEISCRTVEIEGSIYEKKAVLESALLKNKITSIDSYLQKMSTKSIIKEVEGKNKTVQFIESNYFMDENFKNDVKEIHNLLKELKNERVEEKEEKDNSSSEVTSWLELLNKQTNFIESIKDIPNNEDKKINERILIDLENDRSVLSFKEPNEFVTDQNFISEFEALLPGCWKSILAKEISLTSNEKRDRKMLAKAKISCMKGDVKDNFTMIYQFLLFVLNEIPTSGGIRSISSNFALQVDTLFNIENLDDNNNSLTPFYMLQAKPMMLIPEDLGNF